jgi:multidrug efflux system membrane fusion protein
MPVPALIRACASLFLLAVLAACSKPEPAAQADEPKDVRVIVAAPTEIVIDRQLPGRLEAYRQAEVRARVAGIITERLYREGQEVRKGAALFGIDPAPLQAALDMAAADVREAEANAMAAADKIKRYRKLIGADAISQLDYAEALAADRQTQAQVAAAKARRKQARLQLGYATVRAPIHGRARRALVTEGALVGQDNATPLTTVEQIDPIYVNFSQPASDVALMQNAIRQGDLHGIAKKNMPVQLILGDGSVYAHTGKLVFSDLAIDPATDAIAMRAVVPNPERILLPGGYVRVKLEQAVDKTAILIPRDALLRTGNAATVMVVNADNIAEAVTVKADTLHGDRWLVSEGLRGGEKVIVANAASIKPGQPVHPREQTGAGGIAATDPALQSAANCAAGTQTGG